MNTILNTPNEQLKCYGHRGVPSAAPENTLPSFELAYQADVDGIELDVMLSRDGVPIVRHDFDLERTTDGTGYVWDRDWSYLSTLNAAHRWENYPFTPIPRLADVLVGLPDRLIINIELKANSWRSVGLEEQVVALVHEYEVADRTVLSSFNPWWLMRCRRLAPDIPIALIWWDEHVPWFLKKPYFLPIIKPDYLHSCIRVTTLRVVEKAHAQNMQVNVWTPNNRPLIAHLKAIGVDGIITDFPELVRQVNASPLP
ncbi:glycerophosphodiester phosphodiesterase [Candidatus Neomarinimicrobiota bacterium]